MVDLVPVDHDPFADEPASPWPVQSTPWPDAAPRLTAQQRYRASQSGDESRLPQFQRAGPTLPESILTSMADTGRMMTTPPPPLPKGAYQDAGGPAQGTADPQEFADWLGEMHQRGELAPSMALGMIGGGTGFAPRSALGSAGAKMIQPAVEATETAQPGIRAYHGSPHDFDQFDISKIGTGEGAQAYGHGLYFAEAEGTAKTYRDALSRPAIELNGRKIAPQTGTPEDIALAHLEDAFAQQSSAPYARAYQSLLKARELTPETPTMTARNDMDAAIKVLGDWQERGAKPANSGKMYEVNIAAHPDQFLDWDKPLSEQHPNVQEIARKIPGRPVSGDPVFDAPYRDRLTGQDFYRAVARESVPAKDLRPGFDARSPYAATEALRDAGIPGIRYLDQGSRAKAYKVDLFAGSGDKPYATNSFESMEQANRYAAEKEAEGFKTKVSDAGTRNYVVFDPKLIEIVKKYGIAGMAAFPAGAHMLEQVDHDPFAKGRAAGGRVEATNIDPAPTEAQKKAGNYAKDHVHIHGLDITIENAKGATRSGVDRGGKPWSVKMPAAYGYIKGTVGRDKDHVDVYIGPHPKSPHAFVVDQVDADSGKFDEHKAFLGFASLAQAKRAYLAAFSDGLGHQRLGHMAEMSVDTFKRWLENGDTTKRMEGAEHDHKLSHKAVGYIAQSRLPHKHCSVCSMFRAGPHCTLVKNPIAPGGYCRRFDPKD